MRLSAMNSPDKNQPQPLPPVDMRRWAGQTVSGHDPYDRQSGKGSVGFRGAPKNVRSKKD